jgi:chromosome segregation ATPase
LSSSRQKNDTSESYERINHVSKLLEEATKLVEEKDRQIKQLTADLDILKNEREEIQEKCENAVDKDALLKLCMMKNHDLEMQIIDLKNRLSDSLGVNSMLLINQSINNSRNALMMQQCCYPHSYSIF